MEKEHVLRLQSGNRRLVHGLVNSSSVEEEKEGECMKLGIKCKFHFQTLKFITKCFTRNYKTYLEKLSEMEYI